MANRDVEEFRPARAEAFSSSNLAQAAPELQVANLPGVRPSMPAEFGTPVLTGLYEDNPVGPAVPDPYQWNTPQLGGHNQGHGPDSDE